LHLIREKLQYNKFHFQWHYPLFIGSLWLVGGIMTHIFSQQTQVKRNKKQGSGTAIRQQQNLKVWYLSAGGGTEEEDASLLQRETAASSTTSSTSSEKKRDETLADSQPHRPTQIHNPADVTCTLLATPFGVLSAVHFQAFTCWFVGCRYDAREIEVSLSSPQFDWSCYVYGRNPLLVQRRQDQNVRIWKFSLDLHSEHWDQSEILALLTGWEKGPKNSKSILRSMYFCHFGLCGFYWHIRVLTLRYYQFYNGKFQ